MAAATMTTERKPRRQPARSYRFPPEVLDKLAVIANRIARPGRRPNLTEAMIDAIEQRYLAMAEPEPDPEPNR